MLRYALRRIFGVLPTLFIIITLSFFVIRLAPGGPFDEEQAPPDPPRRDDVGAAELAAVEAHGVAAEARL